MKVTGTIKILEQTQSGVSQSTGNSWRSKEVVIGMTEGDKENTIAFRTLNDQCVAELEKCQVGDTIEVEYRCEVKGKDFTRRDGTRGFLRENQMFMVSVKK